MHPQAFPKPNRTRFRGAESDPNPNLIRRNRSESEPGLAKPMRIRTSPGGTDPNPNLARRNRSESEPRRGETDPNPNSGKAIRTRGLLSAQARGGMMESEGEENDHKEHHVEGDAIPNGSGGHLQGDGEGGGGRTGSLGELVSPRPQIDTATGP